MAHRNRQLSAEEADLLMPAGRFVLLKPLLAGATYAACESCSVKRAHQALAAQQALGVGGDVACMGWHPCEMG